MSEKKTKTKDDFGEFNCSSLASSAEPCSWNPTMHIVMIESFQTGSSPPHFQVHDNCMFAKGSVGPPSPWKEYQVMDTGALRHPPCYLCVSLNILPALERPISPAKYQIWYFFNTWFFGWWCSLLSLACVLLRRRICEETWPCWGCCWHPTSLVACDCLLWYRCISRCLTATTVLVTNSRWAAAHMAHRRQEPWHIYPRAMTTIWQHGANVLRLCTLKRDKPGATKYDQHSELQVTCRGYNITAPIPLSSFPK